MKLIINCDLNPYEEMFTSDIEKILENDTTNILCKIRFQIELLQEKYDDSIKTSRFTPIYHRKENTITLHKIILGNDIGNDNKLRYIEEIFATITL